MLLGDRFTPEDPEQRALLALDPGLRTNRVLHDLLLRPRMLGYWTFLEPKHRGTEISDVVVIWGDTAILVEAKTRGVPRPADIGWLREKIGKAVDQLNARVELLKTGSVVFSNEWRGPFRFEPSLVKDYYGVVVLHAEFEPFEWRTLADQEHERATIPVQVFSLLDLAELLRIIDTAWDFVVYFELRAQHSRQQQMLVGREIETFKAVLERMDVLWKGEIPEGGERVQEYWIGRANAMLNTPAATREAFEEWAASLLIDFACAPGETRVEVDSSGGPVRSENHEILIRSIESLAEMSRNRRTEYGRRWIAAAEKALSGGQVSLRSSFSPSRSRSYVLAAWPLGMEPSQGALADLAVREMAKYKASSCLALGASAASVLVTFRALLRFCRKEDAELPGADLLLTPIVGYIGPR